MQVTLRYDTGLISMDKLFCILVTGWASLIVPVVYTQQIALRHNGTTHNGDAFINKDAVFYIECETQDLENLALSIVIPTVPTCALCYPDGYTFVHNDCKDYVQFECLTNHTFRGELTVNAPRLGRYLCTYMSAENDTYLFNTIEPYNVTINGSAYAVMGEKATFTCSTSLAAPRPTFEWLTTDSDGTAKEIDGDKKDCDDEDRHYNTIEFVVSSGNETMDIWCVAKQTAFDVDITSEKLEVDILVRAMPPEWESDTGPIFYEPDDALNLVVSSNDARPKANATWFYLNDTEGQIIDGNQSSWSAHSKIWHAIVFRPSAYHDGVNVSCSVDQGPPLYAQRSALRQLTIYDITTQGPGTTDSTEPFQGLSTGEIIGIVLGSVFGAAILLTIIGFCCCPETFASCGLLSCCVKSATLKNAAENIAIE